MLKAGVKHGQRWFQGENKMEKPMDKTNKEQRKTENNEKQNYKQLKVLELIKE